MMTKRITHIFITTLAALPLVTACSDDLDAPETPGWNNSDVISFTAEVGNASSAAVKSRSGEEERKLYDPLELTDESGMTLYLHTYDSDKIGYEPGEETESVTNSQPASRGMQIETVESLVEHHKDFMVAALYEDCTTAYIGWCNARQSAIGNIWLPDRTYYWPSQQTLNFYAVAPTSEMANLKEFETLEKNSINFGYTARKGSDEGGYGSDRDAESQRDLMLATSSCNKAGSESGHAPLEFNHALSAIKFAVRDVLDGEIINVKIKGVYGTATCEYTSGDEYREGATVWSNHTGKTDYSQNFNYRIDNRPVVDPSDDTQDLVLNEKMPEKTFMLIPQTIPDDARIEVTLRRDNPGKDENGKQLPAEITVSGLIKANGIDTWLPGHEYVYTISTSKDNWVTVLRVYGNHVISSGAHDIEGSLNGDQIYVYSPSETKHDTYGDNAYFKVQSYRYRANDPTHIESLPWVTTHGDGKQYRNGEYLGQDFDISAAEWIHDTGEKELAGDGGVQWDIHKLEMATHHSLTDWPGDLTMQKNDPYTGNSKENPWDLSTCGGRNAKGRNTANCYVIDREGWYCFPLVYGNAIKDNALNPSAYDGDCFQNHTGAKIGGAYINKSYHGSAGMVWSDVYNAVSDIELTGTGENAMIRFHANKGNMQQGNVIIALYDKADQQGDIVWSWHIWVNEHWLDPDAATGGMPNAYDTANSVFDFTANAKSGFRERGDVQLMSKHVGGSQHGYYLAPYNLGWCDPKNVDYLSRPSDLVVTQYVNGEAKNRATVPILQDGAHIEYKFGNNTYYQWGRKDAIVGFVDHANNVKRNFGPKPYEVLTQGVSIATAHKNPQALYCKGTGNSTTENDWCSSHYNRLWDSDGNYSKDNTASVKTVFDPCPPGYKVPTAYALRFIGANNKGKYDDSDNTYDPPLTNLNGYRATDNDGNIDMYTYIISSTDFTYGGTIADEEKIWLTSTGNRWYTDLRYDALGVMGGDNFNPQIVYLWGCTPHPDNPSLMGYGIALGYDTTPEGGYKYCVTSYFNGRRSMARPVRAIRE